MGDFNDTHFVEQLKKREGVRPSRETVRRWRREAGIGPKRKRRAPRHRKRREDIPLLVDHAIEHAFVLCRDDIIRIEDFPERLIPIRNPISLPAGLSPRDIEKTAILQALHRHQGRKVATARELGIDKNTLRRKMIRLGIRLDAGHP